MRYLGVQCQKEKWPRSFEQFSPIYKWSPGGLERCRVVHGGGRRLRRTTDAVGNSGRTTDSFYAASWSLAGRDAELCQRGCP